MSEKLFFIWNGYGVLFTLLCIVVIIISLYTFKKYYGFHVTYFKIPLGVIYISLTVLTSILNNFIAGLLVFPISLVIGVSIGRILWKRIKTI